MLQRLRTGWTARRNPDTDLRALLAAADPGAERADRHLWLIALVDRLRQPAPAERLPQFLALLETEPSLARRCRALLHTVFASADAGTLLADFGFSPRSGFGAELLDRLRRVTLPGTPDTGDLGQLFQMVFHDPGDADWLGAIDAPTLARIERLLVDGPVREHWHRALIDSVQMLASQVRAVGLSASIRPRIDPVLLADRPFHQLAQAAARLAEVDEAPDTPESPRAPSRAQQLTFLRVLLDACRAAAASVRGHLDAWGVSVDVVFQIEQLHERIARIEALLDCLAAPEPAQEWQRLAVTFARSVQTRRSIGALFSHHYAMLARKVAERSAATGEHYITRTRDEYVDMLRRACGGGLVIAGTTFLKFAIGALTLSAFWAGFWTGANYAASFVLIHLLHWTVATKQPAMTAPAMAAKLEGVGDSDAATEDFVDEVTHLMRTQIAGILGNVLVVAPVVLLAQVAAWQWQGAPLINEQTARYVLQNLTLLGPTLLFAAFTGVLLFLSSLIAGWWENWFVLHRLDSAIAHNPRIVRWLGRARAQRWSAWWRANISGLAANCSLGFMLGLVPTLAAFFGLPIEVRHVTLSAGQVAAALGTLGVSVLSEPAFWWCVAAVPLTGALNVLVSFTLAFRLALRSRGLQVRDRGRLHAALRRRMREAPGSFLRPT